MAGSSSRMDNNIPVKELFSGEPEDGSRHVGRRPLPYKDRHKFILKRTDVLQSSQLEILYR